MTAQDRIKAALDSMKITRESIDARVVEHRPRGRHLTVDLNALTFSASVVAAMLELAAARHAG